MQKVKTSPPPTRALHVPSSLHQKVKILAAQRDEDIQDVAVQAIEIGLRAIDTPQPAASN